MNNDTKDKIPSNGNFSAKQDNQGSKLNKPSNTLNKGFNPNQVKDNAQKKLIKEGAKTAANAYFGPAGGAAVEKLSNTKLGQKALDSANNVAKKSSPFNFFGKNKKEDDVTGSGDKEVKNGTKLLLFTGLGGIGCAGCFTVIILIIIIAIIISPLLYIKEFIGSVTGAISSFGEKLGNFLTFRGWCSDAECDEKEKNNFYKFIEAADIYYKDQYSVSLNTTLITATLTYSSPFTTDAEDDNDLDEDSNLDNIASSNYIDFKKSQQKVLLLANNMISKCCYKNGEEYLDSNGNHMCSSLGLLNFSGVKYSCPSDHEEKYKVDLEHYEKYLKYVFIRQYYYDNKYSDEVDKKVEETVREIFSRAAFVDELETPKQYGKVYATCPGVTVVDANGKLIGTYDLETYVAGVITGEAWAGQNIEAYKAQAIAARTLVLKETNNCSTSIESSDSKQVFNPDIADYATEAANATAGLVLIYNDELITAFYDSYCYNDTSCVYGEEDGKRYVEYTKVPNNEKHRVYLSEKYYYMIGGGHGLGMSQVASYEMADNGSSYEEILGYFYSEGVEIANMNTVSGMFSFSIAPPQNLSELLERSKQYKDMGIVMIAGQQFDMSQIYDYDHPYLGQCVWYARGRMLEMIYYSNMDDATKITALNAIASTSANGEGWFDHQNLSIFQKSTDNTQPMPGAFVSWSGGSDVCDPRCGHVAVVESVDYENHTITISEGWNSKGAGGTATWDYVNMSVNTYTFESIKNYTDGSRYSFNGYVYVLGKGE
ncbi:MAG TPA: CHAP domain-containing protein [Candidatus Faecisoma merdavium]|nr:CHAP domain-containing protein [Candidatus Faecisoma merdavium]